MNNCNLSKDSTEKALKFLENKDSVSAIETVLQRSGSQEPLLVFADIFFTTKEAYCFDLLRLLVTHVTKIRLILAITSASRHFYSNKELSWPFQTLLAHCLGNVNIARFTENEAS